MLENGKDVKIKLKIQIKHFVSILYNHYNNMSYSLKFVFVFRKRSTNAVVNWWITTVKDTTSNPCSAIQRRGTNWKCPEGRNC